jgi:hypothetical protein
LRAAGRRGRWSALLAFGARIRAWPARELADLEVSQAPMPLQRKMVPGCGPPGTYTSVTVDPEDEPQTPEPVAPRRALAR